MHLGARWTGHVFYFHTMMTQILTDFPYSMKLFLVSRLGQLQRCSKWGLQTLVLNRYYSEYRGRQIRVSSDGI